MVVDQARDPARDPAWHLALDEALARTGCAAPLLRVWRNAPSVIVGRFQDVDRAVDLAGCAEDGVRVVRRATGGAAVYTGSGTLNVTLVLPRGTSRRRDPRSGAPPGLGKLVATAVEDLGPSAAALRNGSVRTARLRTRHADLAHAAVHVVPDGVAARYIAGEETRPALADLLPGATPERLGAALLAAAEDEFGSARTRPPNALERACRDYLFATRYGDVTWHLMGGAGPSSQPREFTGR
ncbi:biotin/lipoate A/B protein ligase family protein [Actinomadura sp. 21ATH]|uniref:lipoate--protein ligase family protein n=1 Tax=Actinomadura sp. 21ATH TaxID=1735444 RepID=UPI0035C0785E